MFADLYSHVAESSCCRFAETLDLITLSCLEDVDTPLEIWDLLCCEARQMHLALISAKENGASVRKIEISKTELG